MTDAVLQGKIYLRAGDSSLFKIKGACNIFTGMFGVSKNVPFYVLNFDDSTILPNPDELIRHKKTYEGIIYQLETPGIDIPSSRECVFKFTQDFTYIETGRKLIPLTNIAYILFEEEGTYYIAIPFTSVASIEFEYVL